MISRISSRKILANDVSHRIWIIAMASVIGFLIYPLILHFIYIDNSIGVGVEFNVLGLGYSFSYIFLTVMAVLSAATEFFYLHSKERSDFFLSTGIKREKFYVIKWLSGFLTVIIPYIANILISIFIILPINEAFSVERVGTAFVSMGIFILGFAAIYSTSVLAMVLTGRVFVGMCTIALFLAYIPLANVLIDYLIRGNYRHLVITNDNFMDGLIFSPLGALVKAGISEVLGENIGSGIAAMCIWVGSAFFAGLFINKIRKSETAGKAMSFPIMKPVFKIMAGVLLALLIGSVFSLGSGESALATGRFWVGAAIGIVIVQIFLEFIYGLDAKDILRHWKSFIIMAAGIVAVSILIFTDPFRIDKWFPQKERVESMSISEDDYYTFLLSTFGNFTTDCYEKNDVSIKEYEPLYDLVEKYRENDVSQSEYYSSDYYAEAHNLAFKLKGGGTKLRKYSINNEAFEKTIWECSKSEEFRKKLYPAFTVDFSDLSYIELSSYVYSDITLPTHRKRITKEQRDEIIEAYRSDVSELDMLEITRDTPVITMLMANKSVRNEYADDYKYTHIYIYPTFTKTVETLEKITESDIKSIANPDSSVVLDSVSGIKMHKVQAAEDVDFNDEDDAKYFTDKNDIKSILDSVYLDGTGIEEKDLCVYLEINVKSKGYSDVVAKVKDKDTLEKLLAR